MSYVWLTKNRDPEIKSTLIGLSVLMNCTSNRLTRENMKLDNVLNKRSYVKTADV